MNKRDFNEALGHNLEGKKYKNAGASTEKSDVSGILLTKY